VTKTVRFMATRRPNPLRHPGELPSRAAQIAGFALRRAVLARRARRAPSAAP